MAEAAREGYATNGAVELYTVAEGAPDGPAVVLVNGLGSTSVMWCRELTDPLVEAGHRVVRFDHRDIGRSTRLPATVAYTVADMAADLVAVLDHWEIEAAHVLGRSLGGAVGLEAALVAPQRVRSLVLVYTSAALVPGPDDGLPGPEPWVVEAMSRAAFEPPPSTDAERIARRMTETELYSGSRFPFDADWARAEAVADVEHAPYAEHGQAQAVTASPSRLGNLASVPHRALVLHGTADPIVPVEHGRRLARDLPNATLVEYEGLGHEMPPAWCREIIPALLRHLANSG